MAEAGWDSWGAGSAGKTSGVCAGLYISLGQTGPSPQLLPPSLCGSVSFCAWGRNSGLSGLSVTTMGSILRTLEKQSPAEKGEGWVLTAHRGPQNPS